MIYHFELVDVYIFDAFQLITVVFFTDVSLLIGQWEPVWGVF